MRIFYTGIGTQPESGGAIHTVNAFLDIMESIFHVDGGPYTEDQLQFENCNLPRDFQTFNLHQWLRYSGGTIVLDIVEQ